MGNTCRFRPGKIGAASTSGEEQICRISACKSEPQGNADQLLHTRSRKAGSADAWHLTLGFLYFG